MRAFRHITVAALALASVLPATAMAATVIDADGARDGGAGSAVSVPNTPGHLECVPYARTTSGIQLYGDAWTWWGQAKGRYATGGSPRVGAVMAIKPFNNSKLGHVATVSRIVDARTVLLSHANWSVPGEIERNVTALDVSPNNDWSEVRIWYGPSRNLGNTHWPVSGFIYNAKPGTKFRDAEPDRGEVRLAFARDGSPAKKKGRRSDPIGDIIAGKF
ncbi:CHAP domain-containing protein [Novosphingobium resinovorum]|uniref:CHAP domain-containing protein n=1 Tax=Novosphingobium TaxID=165696 RepID=UPI001B3C6B11|nr:MULTISPECIES: CHAP domain-containing protein [Novosphingobium]MBF7012167.1 CHAP domain-containing protein [Novosphingobium sp. HR1a]WJM26914.1 CHAP domain-containing protein [Novosphingobium resinovorum]